MKRLRKKFQSRRGMTLSELLMAILVLGLLTAVIAAGVGTAAKVYRRSRTVSEAQTLTSTLTQSIANELRYASNIRVSGTGEDARVVFDSTAFGPAVSVLGSESDGVIRIGAAGGKKYDLLGSAAYSSGLSASSAVEYDEDKGLFQLKVTVESPGMEPREVTLTIRALNPS